MSLRRQRKPLQLSRNSRRPNPLLLRSPNRNRNRNRPLLPNRLRRDKLSQMDLVVVENTSDSWTSNHRRYCFLKMRRGLLNGDDTDLMWDGKRRAIAGTAIPAEFPARAALLRAGYLVVEELDGANASELQAAGLSSSQSAAVLAAIG